MSQIATNILVVALVLALANPASACSCRALTLCELIQQPTLFIGEVIDGGVSSIRDDPWYTESDHVRFRVLERFRGLTPDTKIVEMETFTWPGMCAPNPYRPGRIYLVAPGKNDDGKFIDGGCFKGRDVEAYRDDVRQVREYFAGNTPTHIRGQVGVAKDSNGLPGVRISTVGGKTKYSTLSDASGRYLLALPAGTYQLRAALDSYGSPRDVRVSVPAEGCAVADFGLSADNVISGKVRNEKGEVLRNVRVGLIDIDQQSDDSHRESIIDVYSNEKDGSFKFTNIPTGRYLLAYNPDGAHIPDEPFESTYYPAGSSRITAQVLNVDSSRLRMSGMDLVQGSKVDFRSVSIHVRFKDGVPMNTATISCVGLPSEVDTATWVVHTSTNFGGDGVAQCSVPVNRRLRIVVKDAYGRDLGAIHEATHEAGNTAIVQEFEIRD